MISISRSELRSKEPAIGEAIIRPSRSCKEYKCIDLENGLSVLLVSDQLACNAVASMAVRVGGSLDPPQVPGLSHFLEHMVMDESQEFFSERGGFANAFTAMDHSIFSMQIKADFLQNALERFSQLFIAPNLKRESVESEIKAVNSEFELKKLDDRWRLDQLRGHTSTKGHPFNRFISGNKKSLSLSDSSLSQYAENLFNKCYVGASMKLVVLGPENLGTLERLVSKYFARIKPGSENIPHELNPTGRIWKADTMYQLEAIGDVNTFELSWMIPPRSIESCLERPDIYLTRALNNKREGSLFSLLKEKGWITALDVIFGVRDCSYQRTSIGSLFTISIELTSNGLKEKHQLVGYIYQYLKLLIDTSPPEWFMEEYWCIKRMKFECLDIDGIGTDPYLFTQELAANMLDYPDKHVVSGDFLNLTCTTQAIKELLTHFNPENMRIDLLSKSFQAEDFETEPWYKSHYLEKEIPNSWKEAWNNISQVDRALCFPAKNEFIPTGFSFREYDADNSFLDCIVDETWIKLWYKCEEGLSSTNFFIHLNAGLGVKNHVMAKLFVELLDDKLCDITYQGKEASFTTSLSLSNDNKVEFTVNGFRQMLRRYIMKIWEQFKSFLPVEERFLVIKETMARDLRNEMLDLTYQSNEIMAQLACERCYATSDMLESLDEITFDGLIQFIPVLRSQIFIEGICFGDIREREAAEKISEIFAGIAPLPEELRGGNKRKKLCDPKIRKDVKVRHELEANSVAKVCFQTGQTGGRKKDVAMLYLLSNMMEQKLSDQLRSKENLGYSVQSQVEVLCGTHYFSVAVTSWEYDPDHLLARIYKFMEGFEEFMEGVDDKTFENYKKATALPDDSGESAWKQIVEGSYYPDFYLEVYCELEEIKVEDIVKFYKKYFIPSSRNCHRLEVCIWGCNTNRRKRKQHFI